MSAAFIAAMKKATALSNAPLISAEKAPSARGKGHSDIFRIKQTVSYVLLQSKLVVSELPSNLVATIMGPRFSSCRS